MVQTSSIKVMIWSAWFRWLITGCLVVAGLLLISVLILCLSLTKEERMNLVITQYGSRYDVDTGDGRLHILNLNSLKWNLKHIFKFKPREIKQVLIAIQAEGRVVVERVAS